MKTGKGTRGRPKGTGINDVELLARIAEIIVDNPDIKRTTAIKLIGIDNPSIVRRLRDKFAVDADKYINEVKASRAAKATAAETASKGRKRAAKAAPVAAPAPVAATVAAPAAVKPAVASKPAPATEQPINIEALVTRVLGQALGIPSEAFSNTPIFALLREQMRLVDQVLPLLRTQIHAATKAAQAA